MLCYFQRAKSEEHTNLNSENVSLKPYGTGGGGDQTGLLSGGVNALTAGYQDFTDL